MNSCAPFPPPPPTRRLPAAGVSPLLRKYRDLTLKHDALVRRLNARTTESLSTWRLAAWALETSDIGLALLRGGVMQLANARWHTLGRAQSAGWRQLRPEAQAPEGSSPATLREAAQVEARAVLAQAEAGPRVTRYQRRNGGQTLELRAERVGPPRESLVVVLAQDVTAQVRAEEELQRAREILAEREPLYLLGEMVSGIAHDLGSTLHALRLRLELLQDDPECAARQQAPLEALMRIILDASTRIHHLQDFSRQRPERPGEQVQLRDVVRDAVEIVRGDIEHRAARKGVPLRIDVAMPPLPPVRGSAAELRYVFLNLLLNARDAMPRGGTVRVRGRREGPHVIVTVEDEGTGISEEHLRSIFRPFFTTKGHQGTGLGLSMAYDVVSRAGGVIKAANRPHGGAVFTLTFPALPVPPPPRRSRQGRGGR